MTDKNSIDQEQTKQIRHTRIWVLIFLAVVLALLFFGRDLLSPEDGTQTADEDEEIVLTEDQQYAVDLEREHPLLEGEGVVGYERDSEGQLTAMFYTSLREPAVIFSSWENFANEKNWTEFRRGEDFILFQTGGEELTGVLVTDNSYFEETLQVVAIFDLTKESYEQEFNFYR